MATSKSFNVPPDPRYYQAILQHDDGTWSADQKPLDDRSCTVPDLRNPGQMMLVTIFGLKSVVKSELVNTTAQNYIYKYAPVWKQTNATQVIHDFDGQTGLPADQQQELDEAKALWAWIDAVIAYSDSLCAQVMAMTFDQIVVWVVPSTGWPDPPTSLIDVPPPLATGP